MPACSRAVARLYSCTWWRRPPSRKAMPSMNSEFVTIAPAIEAFTRSSIPARSAVIAITSSVRLPSVALSRPPTASPVRAATLSVAWLSRAASGTMASTDNRNRAVWASAATRSTMNTTGTTPAARGSGCGAIQCRIAFMVFRLLSRVACNQVAEPLVQLHREIVAEAVDRGEPAVWNLHRRIHAARERHQRIVPAVNDQCRAGDAAQLRAAIAVAMIAASWRSDAGRMIAALDRAADARAQLVRRRRIRRAADHREHAHEVVGHGFDVSWMPGRRSSCRGRRLGFGETARRRSRT